MVQTSKASRISALVRTVVVTLSSMTLMAGSEAFARQLPDDPFDSVMWKAMAERYMPEGDIVFDDRVVVMAPLSAENQFHVPITVDASALDDVQEIIAVADLNPIPLILRMQPGQAHSFIGFRLKLQQTSPVHVGVRTADGVWHVAGAVVDAAGGGCTAPAAAHGTGNWMQTLGETRALVNREDDSTARVKLRIRHPMDTGLAAGIPAFYLDELNITDDGGESVVQLQLFEPVSENPTITLKPIVGDGRTTLQVDTRDTEANESRFNLVVPALADI